MKKKKPHLHPCFYDLSHSSESFIHWTTSCAVPVAMIIEEIQQEVQKDKCLQKVISLVQSEKWFEADDDPCLTAFRKIKDELTVDNKNKLLIKGSKIVVPDVLKLRAIQLAHEGHLGVSKTKALFREKVWFCGIDKLVNEVI